MPVCKEWGCRTELGWEERVSGQGSGGAKVSDPGFCHLRPQSSDCSKNSKFKPDFPSQHEREFVKENEPFYVMICFLDL